MYIEMYSVLQQKYSLSGLPATTPRRYCDSDWPEDIIKDVLLRRRSLRDNSFQNRF